jgi:hypothetical protein
MKRPSALKVLLFLLVFLTGFSVCEAQPPAGTGPVGRTKTGFFARIFDKKPGSKVSKPKSVSRIKKEQAKKDKKEKGDYAKSVNGNKKRSYQIQTPEVQTRMKQNQKEITEREKTRKKKVSESTKKARKKYKK